MVKEFYQVAEITSPNKAKKFKPIRDALSHPFTLKSETIGGLKTNFRRGYFILTKRDQFDYTLPRNMEHLEKQANILMRIAMQDLRRIL